MLDDTIAALATPPGVGALALVRVSGREAIQVAERVFVPAGRHAVRPAAAPSHTLHYGHICRDGAVVDEVLLAVMRAPRTFTRQDVVEITCHGGRLTARLVLEAVLAQGARLANPGEFTLRAFLNGRLDLTQAEAVADMIQAETELALRAARAQLAGKLSQSIRQLREDLLQVLAEVEAQLDFPEDDIPPPPEAELLGRLEHGLERVEGLLRTAHEGQILRHGLRTAIIGRPNVGKSSLLNRLLGHDRAIVSPVPGTTRDTIEETANIGGLPVVLVDTAGLRAPADEVELEGIRRSRAAVDRAELVLHVLDGSEPLTAEDRRFLGEFAAKKRILVCNKADLPRRLDMRELRASHPDAASNHATPGTETVLEVSCLTGQGLEALRDAIRSSGLSQSADAACAEIAISARHQEVLLRVREAMNRAMAALQQALPWELMAVDLHEALRAAGEITGETVTEDLLETIFSRFCIGK